MCVDERKIREILSGGFPAMGSIAGEHAGFLMLPPIVRR
jgi:hypothetical protein